MKIESKYFILNSPYKITLKELLKKCYYALKAAFYKMKMFTVYPKIKEKIYNVSICAIFKNEAPYLKEWIEFNNIIGVEHFYMYNNNSEDDFMKVLKPYVESGLVTYLEWPHNQKQMECYIDCIEKFASDTKWLGFIDIDEFIVPKSTDNIYDFLKPFEKKAGAVIIYWKLFGSSGIMKRNLNNLVIEDMTVCWPKYCDIGKCFYNTAFGFNSKSKHVTGLHHCFWANWKGKDIPPVNVFGNICFNSWNAAKKFNFPIQINHYFTKSYKEKFFGNLEKT